MIKDKLYTLIATIVLFVFTFYFLNLSILDKILMICLLVLLWIFGIISYKKDFLNEINYYNFGYFFNLILFLLFITYLIIIKYLPVHNKIYFTIPITLLSLIIFIFAGIFPYLKYKGLKIDSPDKLRVPIGITRTLDFYLKNKKPHDSVIEVNISLPSNVSFKDGTKEKTKRFSIKANHTLPLKFGLKSTENNQSRFTFIKIKDDSGKEFKKKVELIT